MGEISPRRFNARLGMTLFVVYLALYLGFVLINAFAPEWMEVTTLGGLNLALVYGFGLILAALLLAFIYGWFCRPETDATTAHDASPVAPTEQTDAKQTDAKQADAKQADRAGEAQR